MFYRSIGIGLGLVVLAGCGGSSSGVSRDASFETLGNSFAGSLESFIDSDGPTDLSDLPRGGTLAYTGTTVYVEGESNAFTNDFDISYLALGDLVVTVDLADQQITGDAQNFYEVTNDPTEVEFVGADSVAISGRLDFDVDLGRQVFPSVGLGTVTGEIDKFGGETVDVDIEILGALFDGTNNVLLTSGDDPNEAGQNVIAIGTQE